MITDNPYGTRHIIKPGYGEPEPLEPVSTMDTPENVAACQRCPLPDCNAKSLSCLLRKKPGRDSPMERDNKIRDLINAGWRNNDAICEELGICKSTLSAAKRRLRERGEIK